ncbi:MAG: twin-arginine translocation signal domain-containing protein, partial [Thermoguttaceae bacterium]|nr:twin-arginine translocation signal domain-containing protein [Thermoguttaceae bacterium]
MSTQNRDFSRRNFLKTGTLLSASALGGLAPFETLASTAFAAPNPEAESADAPKFVKAVPVWAAGREKEMNVTLVFVANFDLADAEAANRIILRSTGSTIMRVRVNGKFAGYGPARGPHGWFRVDEWKIGALLKPGQNRVVIEVAGYNANSYYHLDQPSFLQAEIVDGAGNVLAAT